jgi:protein-tyrosine-phosphatase
MIRLVNFSTGIGRRAAGYAALGDPVRLAVVDELRRSDRSPIELQCAVALPSNLLAHHLDVLERAGLITRSRSNGDGRRRYVQLEQAALAELDASVPMRPQPALFVCTHNSARSQIAQSLWRQLTGAGAESAGTHPAHRVHPGAIAAARRAGLDLRTSRPRPLEDIARLPALVVTVCDRAHEELEPGESWVHWSVPDPVPINTPAAFDATVIQLRRRISVLIGAAA